jgi:hypothetical protein
MELEGVCHEAWGYTLLTYETEFDCHFSKIFDGHGTIILDRR